MATDKILIVDDEPDLEMLIRQRFRREVREGRYEFVFARNGVEALAHLRDDQQIEVVLSDINMPEMDGLTLLGQIAQLENPVLKAVIVSAYGDMENIRTAMNRGAFDFLTKPIDFRDLEITIKKTLDQLATLKNALKARDELVSLQKELHLAARIQQSIVPRKFPPFPGRNDVDILAEMWPAREVGGDFYDFFLLDSRHLGFVIGDVSGKGMPAAIFMALTRALLKATAQRADSPSECMERVNTLLCAESTAGLFVTGFYGILDTETGALQYTFAGHPPPYRIEPGGRVTPLPGQPGMILGIFEGAQFVTSRSRLAHGDTVFLFTDGVTEAQDPAGNLYGEERLEAFLATLGGVPLSELLSRTVEEIHIFAAGAPQSDDLTLLAVRWR